MPPPLSMPLDAYFHLDTHRHNMVPGRMFVLAATVLELSLTVTCELFALCCCHVSIVMYFCCVIFPVISIISLTPRSLFVQLPVPFHSLVCFHLVCAAAT